MSPKTAHHDFQVLRRFLTFLSTAAAGISLREIDHHLLDAYLAVLRAGNQRSANVIAHGLEIPINLYRYGDFLTEGGLAINPWQGRPAFVVAGCGKRGENATPRIPEDVISALLKWALRYVDVYAVDILAARHELEALKSGHTARVAVLPGSQGAVRKRLVEHIAKLRESGRGVPIWNAYGRKETGRIDRKTGRPVPPINWTLLKLQLGATSATQICGSDPSVKLIVDAVEELGVECGGFDTPISIDPDTGRPWRARFDSIAVAFEEEMLQTACYIVCAYLTGMRDSEIQAMRAGCHTIERSADGLVERHRIRSTCYKWRGAKGSAESWITIAPVGRAIDVLEKLTAAPREQRGIDILWLPLRSRGKDYLGCDIVRLLNTFRDHISGLPDRSAVPAGPGGKPWALSTVQFRRTIAWWIANRPFGTVAGKIQYKHASVGMFEGYAGASTSGFRRQVEQERRFGQLDDIVTHYENVTRQGAKPAGPAAARLVAEFQRVRRDLGELPGQIASSERIRAMLGHLARTLHVGFLNDCFFDASTAMCLEKSNATDRSAPVLSHCVPDRCPNSCITRQHLPAWQASIAEAERLLENKRLSAYQRQAIKQDNDRKRRLIGPLMEQSP